MKRLTVYLMILMLLVTLCSCFAAPQEENYNLPVTEEPFESFDVSYSFTTHMTFNSHTELYENSDLVFIGMPTDTFTECERVFYNLQGEQIPEDSTEKSFDRYTLRNVKVLEVIKGDYDSDEITVADMAIFKTNENGEGKIIGLPSSAAIQKRNVKYIYYAHKANDKNNDYYFTHLDSGLINVDGLHPNVNKGADKLKLQVMQWKYEDKFIKYDRSAELAAEKTEQTAK